RVQTEKLAELGYFMQSQSLISKIDLPHQHQFIDWVSIRNHVQMLLTNNNPTDLTKFVRELNQLIYKYEHYDRISTELLYINILQKSVHHLRELGKHVDSYFDTDLAIAKYAQECLYYSDLHQTTLAILLRWSQSVIAPDDENETIIKAFIAYIDQNFANNITLDSLSSHLFISRSTLCMLIKNKLGQTVNEYINERRLMQGRDFLMNTDMSITDIAMRSGFSDANYFIKRYKKQYGLTPQVDRKRLRRSEPYEC
ncbi:MAG: AraC family transcriptional regulator, partial [Paludibacter sp.]|nr:AraC family transcriptional regulator [Paludibacter sp.]